MARTGSKGRQTGRRSKLTKERQEIIVAAIEKGCTFKLAAQAAGIDERTLYRWLEKGEDGAAPLYSQFRQAIKRAEGQQAERLLALIERHAITDWKAAAWMLERRHGYATPQALALIEKTAQDKVSAGDDTMHADILRGVEQIQEAGGVAAVLDGEVQA